MRIAIGGFQHETNTFAPSRATLEDFLTADAWPGLTRATAMLDAVHAVNLPISGFIDAARGNHTLIPLTWCSATPSARVTRDAYEHIVSMLIDDLKAARHLDALYLDLHGAMVAEHIDDADGELLRRMRSLLGPHIPIIASLDYHANVSPLMVEQATALIAYRTYPHVDMAQTGERSLECLQRLQHRRVAARLQQLPFLIPLISQCTLIEPMSGIMQEVAQLESDDIAALNFTPGFPAADVAECGPAVFGYGSDAASLDQAVTRLASSIQVAEARFAIRIDSIETAMHALTHATHARGRPIILADTQDNPGGGGTAATTSLLKALLAHRIPRVLAGIFCDPNAAQHAHAAGVGATIELELGANCTVAMQTPLASCFQVLALGDGRFTATGPFYRGARMELGPMALLRSDDLHIAVASRKQQAADQAMFRHLGIEPRDFAVLALKSSVHFRADFGNLASRILVVEAPGPNVADPAKLPFTKLRPCMRVATASS